MPQGAFDFSYEYAWDEGYLALMDDALKLKDEAMTGTLLPDPRGVTTPTLSPCFLKESYGWRIENV